MTAFLDDQLRHVAETALGNVTTAEPRSVEPLGRGNRKETAFVQYDDRSPVVVQLCDEQTWLQTEAALLGQIQDRTDVPVPPVLAAGIADGVAYMVTAYIPGTDLHEQFAGFDLETQQRLAEIFGRHLGTLHERFQFDNYGSLVVDDGHLNAWRPDWNGWFGEYARHAVETLPSVFDPVRDDLLAVVTDPELDQSPPARLFPWDFRPGNALVDDRDVAAILDWEAPMAAGPALSAAKAEYLIADWYVENATPLQEAFVDGYEQIRDYPEVKPAHRVAAIAASAVDSTGTVTNPRYPELDKKGAVEFHRGALVDAL